MRRIAATLAVVATLVAPLHALAGVALACDGVRASDACCCPSAEADGGEEGDSDPAARGICCCDIEPAAPVSAAPVASAPGGAAVERTNDESVRDVPAPESEDSARPQSGARAPPAASSLFAQNVSLLL